MSLILTAATAVATTGIIYAGYRLNKRRNQRLLREARRKKYAPDLPPLINSVTNQTVISANSSNQSDKPPVERTKQIEELTEKEYDSWQERDEDRDANIMQLRLILEDVISDLTELEDQHSEEYTEQDRIM
ncbi:MAG TPA: hypothetical protein HA354_02100, partial [Candidatus Poseidoniaceae archaeon]